MIRLQSAPSITIDPIRTVPFSMTHETRESGDKLSSVPRHRDHVVGRDESREIQVPNPETGNFMPARRRGADNVQPEEHRLGAPEVREVRLRQGLLRPALPRK